MDITSCGTNVDRIQRRLKVPFTETPPTNSVPIAAFVTDYARDVLFDSMVRLNAGSLLYCDTDSLIFISPIGAPSPVQEGNYLGMMTDERPGRRIVEFVGGG